MWSTNKKDRCLRSSLLTINCAACVAIVYIYVTYMGKEENMLGILSENIIQPEKLTAENCTPVCESRACVWHANLLLRNVNSTADPCENFHSFLCNGFQEKLGPDEEGNVPKTEVKGSMLNRLKGILNNIEADPESASGKMKIVYDSCVNTGSSELQTMIDVKNFLNTIGILNWPHLPKDFSFNGISLPTIIGKFIETKGFETKGFLHLKQVVGNETQQDRLLVDFNGFWFDKSIEVPRALAVSMLKYFDLETKDINAIIEDHERVKNSITNLTEDFGNCNENCDAVAYINCSKQHDNDWHEFCETIRFVLNVMNEDKRYDTNTIAIRKPADMFFKNLYPVLHSFTNRSLANFVALIFLKEYQAEMNFYFRLTKLKYKDFASQLDKDRYELDRWKYCVRWIADKMKLPLENEFFHQYLTNSVTEEIINLFHDYLSDLTEIVALQEWIPTESKTYLVESIKSTTLNIEFLRRIVPNDTYANKVYEEFHPTKESFFNNALGLKKTLMFIQPPINPYYTAEEIRFDVQAEAGYTIAIHFGYLLPPFHIPGHISVINRLLLSGIGHEFGHNIFNMLDDLLENDEKYLQKKQCLEDQFSRFKYENLNEYLSGSQFLYENFADNVETTLIDKAIEQYSASQDIILPGLPYSTKQLLYMSANQVWCSKSNLKRDLLDKNLDPHAPNAFRLLGKMQNSRGLPEAFHCPKESFMNPATKCSLLDAYEN